MFVSTKILCVAEVNSAQPFFLDCPMPPSGMEDTEVSHRVPFLLLCTIHLIHYVYLSDASLLLQIKIQTLRCVGTEELMRWTAV